MPQLEEASFLSGHFRQYIADNADRNPWTIDGQKSLHAMGMVETVTPEIKHGLVIRRTTPLSIGRVRSLIPIKYYDAPKNDMPIYYRELSAINCTRQEALNLDILCKVAWPLRPSRPGWTGLMKTIYNEAPSIGKSSINFLPLIDLDPTNMSCIFSTLSFITKQCLKHGCTPIVTFDQPLWYKARKIVNNEPSSSELKNIVLELGGFHAIFSLISSIGHVMVNSGLREVLCQVYGENAVVHMLNGKSYSRAVRGLLSVDAALGAILLSTAYDLSLDENLQDKEEDLPQEIQKCLFCLEKLTSGQMNVTDLSKFQTEYIDKVALKLQMIIDKTQHKTAQLWIQLIDMIDLLKSLIRAQRLGDWHLHLCTLQKMVYYFAATGHRNYGKSVQLYLQDMDELQTKNKFIYDKFSDGLFVVRRSNNQWAGLPKDLVIEQTLMRTMKATAGLVHGRGILDENQRNIWLLSMPACASVNEAMQNLTNINTIYSEQHKELANARMKRDQNDDTVILNYLIEHNPFDYSEELRNIATGETADKEVNCYLARETGKSIMAKLYGEDAITTSFRKKDEVITMDIRKKQEGGIQVDPQLLFQRLIAVGKKCSEIENISELLQFELTSHPSALFDENGLIRAANKAQISDALAEYADTTDDKTLTEYYVFDGGSLIHLILWTDLKTFGQICAEYVKFLKKYSNPLVVFDGYNGPSTKDTAHMRRTKGVKAPTVIGIDEKKPLRSKKNTFLANEKNKADFISLLRSTLEENGIETKIAEGDADLMIVKTAIEVSKKGTTTLIGDDNDLLVLLCYHSILSESSKLFMRSEKKKSKYKWDIGALRQSLGLELCKLMPFIHAIGGSDTTSRFYGIGKGVPLKKARISEEFRQAGYVFLNPRSTADDITKAGVNATLCLYGANIKQTKTLGELRFRRFQEKTLNTTTQVEVRTLPPTEDGLKYHSHRVYLQIQSWTGNELEPTVWGWELEDGLYRAKKMNNRPAPERLIEIIRCHCKGDCQSTRCSCRKYGLECTTACGECKGLTCTNVSVVPTFEESYFDELDLV